MKITFILKEFPKESETFIQSQITGLSEYGHEINVVSLKTPKSKDSFPENISPQNTYNIIYAGCESNDFKRTLNTARAVISNISNPGFLWFLVRHGNSFNILLYPAVVSEVIAGADVIIIHFGDTAHKITGVFKKLDIRKPYLVFFHGYDVSRFLPSIQPEKRSQLWDTMTLGLPVSQFWKEYLVFLGCPAGKLKVFHMGVDTEKFRYQERSLNSQEIHLTAICRLIRKKGLDIAIQGIREVLKQKPGLNIVLDIVGEGPEKTALEKMAGSFGIEKHVVFHGWLSQKNIKNILETADIFTLPSRTAENGDMEGIPVSLMEAMSCGLPVISTYHSGIPELVTDGISGLLIKENDVKGFTDALLRLIDEPGLALKLGTEASRAVRNNFNLFTRNKELEATLLSITGEEI